MTHVMMRSKHTTVLARVVFFAGKVWTQEEGGTK